MTSVLVLALLFAQQAVPPEKCTLAGTAADSLTGLPLGKVTVVAQHIGGHDPGASTVTDAKGNFLLVDVDPGEYHLSFRRNGYLDAYFGTKRPSDSEGSAITLTAGQKLEDLQAKLIPFGVIAGTVRDSDGEPLAGAAVEIFFLRRDARRRRVETFDSRIPTDDLGQYRIVHLPPGQYYVSASLRPRDEDAPTVDHSAKLNKPPETPITTFYPGTTDPSGASAVDLGPGARATGLDIKIIRGPLYKITAHIDAAPGLEVGAGLHYAVEGFGEVGHPRTKNKNDIEITGVPAGSYIMQFGADPPQKPFDGMIDITAQHDGCETRIPISVERGDVEGLRLVAGACAEVSGHVIRDDGKPLKHEGFPPSVRLDGEDRGEYYLKSDSLFRITPSPGHHEIDFSSVTHEYGLYLKSVHSGNLDTLRDGFTVASAEHIDLEVVLGSDGGRIEGIASNADGKPVPGASVVLIPNDPALRSRSDYTLSVLSDHSGHFEIKNAAPGEYKLFAWDDIENESWLDPDVVRNFEARGYAVTVKAKAPDEQANPSQTVNLTVIQ